MMKCVSGNSGHYLCVNRYCSLENSFICSDTQDRCKESHQSCSLLSLSYIVKKSNIKPTNSRHQALVPVYDKAKLITNLISNVLSSIALSRDIDKMLSSQRPLTGEDKDKISKFVGDKKIQTDNDFSYRKIEKQLEQFQFLITQFEISMKEKRNKQIQDLKRKLHEEQKNRYNEEEESPIKSKISKLPQQSAIKNKKNEEREKVSSIQKNPQRSNGPSPVKSRVMVQEKIPQKPKNSGFQQKMSSILKSHVPKSPLFSRITNDIKTINTLFYNKFESAKLLYRASENEYLVSKFHEKCDGHKQTLTIILTEFDKIIGGYTPLSWKTGGGEWYEDQAGKSFLFNLTSGQRYPLNTKDKAIWCSRGYGPSFGHPDLQVADKAFYNSNSCANFPNCYNNGNYKNSPGSTQLFCGTKNGHFRIKEWQVYQLTFS